MKGEKAIWGGLLILLGCGVLPGQDTDKLQGWVLDAANETVLPQTHVVNKTTLKGTLSDEQGYFAISISLGDTIVFSNIAYQYFYFVYQDSSQPLQDVVVEMQEQNYLLNEVSVFAYELTTNDPKAMTLQRPAIPTNAELPQKDIFKPTLANPVDYLYYLFGSKPKELRKLAELQKADAYRAKLEDSHNRESVLSLTGLNEEDLQAFMFYCKFAPVQIRTMNDYQYLKSLQHCYRQYIRDRELEGFLEQFD